MIELTKKQRAAKRKISNRISYTDYKPQIPQQINEQVTRGMDWCVNNKQKH